jgi:uncharacterized protein
MNRLELVRNEIDTILLNQADDAHRRDGYVHLYGVAQNCAILAIKRGLDVELCTVIGMLHDIYTYKYNYVKNHAVLGVVEAESLLRKLNVFSDEEISIVKNAICNHSNKKIKNDKYSELIKDADVLQNSLYNLTFEIKHKDRLKKIFKNFGVRMKFKKLKARINNKSDVIDALN